jgi:anion-transporting  ArsA/GET3 family ATPase
MASDTDSAALERLLAAKEIVIVCGSGGVGKTTTAAAAGLMAASQLGGKVLVLTVDPARRLATALGLDGLDDSAKRIPDELAEAAGLEMRGELWAAMLDTQKSWDRLVANHAPDDETRDSILSNPLYRNVTGKFVHSHDYVAMERLHDLHSSGGYDLIIVDTPPSRHAIDFLEAPDRMADFFSSRLLRWLTMPARSRLVSAASRPFASIAERVLGSQFLADIAEFFVLFRTMYPGFVERSQAVQRTLRDRRTTFVVVSTLEAASVSECEFFIHELDKRDLHLGAVVLNRVLPDYLRGRQAATAARSMVATDEADVEELAEGLADRAAVARVLNEVAESFLDYRVPATREAELLEELEAAPDVLATVPFIESDITDFDGLARIGAHLWR